MNPVVVLVTGATSGIGRHAALHFARAGHRVFATGRNAEALAILEREAQGTALETLSLDVTSESDIAAARDEVLRRTEGYGLDVLVNNAGYGLTGPIEEIALGALRAQFETNVFGLAAMTQAFLPEMRARGAGRIVNVSSIGGRVTFPFMGAYQASKYAVESLSDALRMELGPFGVNVALIEPGPVASEFADRALASMIVGPRSPYAKVAAAAEEAKKRLAATEIAPLVVSKAILHAATARRPKARYVVPRAMKVFLWLMRVLPTAWTDAALRASAGLSRKRLGLPPASSCPLLG